MTPEEIIGIDFRVDYDLDNLKTLADISNKILDIELSKRFVLEDFKDSDKTMPKAIYESTVNHINAVYDGFLRILEERRQKILSEIISSEQNARLLDEISVIKRLQIKVGFRFKALKYENRLFTKRCKAAQRVTRAALRERFRIPMPPKKIVLPVNKFIITGPVPP